MARKVVLVRNDWESDFFGREILRLEIDPSARPDRVEALAARMVSQAPARSLIEVVLDRDSPHWAGCQRASFWLADAIVEFQLSLRSCDLPPEPEVPVGVGVRVADLSDVHELRQLAARMVFPSRFGRPPFTATDSRRFYTAWVENAVRGTFDDLCLVAESDGGAAGFASLRLSPEGACRIGLFGVDTPWRGRGVAALLWQEAARFAQAQGRTVLLVATQTDNEPATRFYARQGAQAGRVKLHGYREMSRVASQDCPLQPVATFPAKTGRRQTTP